MINLSVLQSREICQNIQQTEKNQISTEAYFNQLIPAAGFYSLAMAPEGSVIYPKFTNNRLKKPVPKIVVFVWNGRKCRMDDVGVEPTNEPSSNHETSSSTLQFLFGCEHLLQDNKENQQNLN